MIDLYIADWRTLGMEAAFFDNLPLLPEQERAKVMRFVRMEDRVRCLTGLLLRRMAAKRHTDLAAPEFAETDYGKPYVKDGGDFRFNVSHSGDLVVCACGSCEIGVDVEQVVPVDLEEYRRIFSESEQKQMEEAEDPIAVFYYLWTVREAFVKKEGIGIPLFDKGGEFCYDGKVAAYDGQTGYVYSFCHGDYRISLCSDRDEEIQVTYEESLQI